MAGRFFVNRARRNQSQVRADRNEKTAGVDELAHGAPARILAANGAIISVTPKPNGTMFVRL